MTTHTKTVNEIYDYGFDYTDHLDTGDTISTSSWTIPSGLTQGTASNDTVTTSVFLSGGTLDDEYTCVNKIVTANARTIERAFVLRIVDKKYQ